MKTYPKQWALITAPKIGVPRVVACSRIVGMDAEELDCDPIDMGIDLGSEGALWRRAAAEGYTFLLWQGSVTYSSDDEITYCTDSLYAVAPRQALFWAARHEEPQNELPEERAQPDGTS